MKRLLINRLLVLSVEKLDFSKKIERSYCFSETLFRILNLYYYSNCF